MKFLRILKSLITWLPVVVVTIQAINMIADAVEKIANEKKDA